MFGYVTPNKKDLSPEEEARYRAAYCGLCHALKTRHGAVMRFALQYDFAFLVLLLDSLYEPERSASFRRCAAHPLCKRAHEQTDFTDYAADMTVALFYHKCLDDWRDEKRLLRRAQAFLMKRRYEAVARLRPAPCAAIGEALEELSRIERDADAPADAAAAAFGEAMAALFAPRADRWEAPLRAFGMALGRFLYMMDAWDDCARDARRGNFNPFASDRLLPDFDARAEAILTALLGECAAAFERLPLVEDIGLMRNVIYSGVWTRFEWKRVQREAKACR